MKELSIEQKAKRYDEALERMKAWVKGEYPECFTGAQKTAEFIFPELKESEDERIKKAIMEFFELQDDNTTYSFIPKKDILTWLEKQGEKKSADKVEPKFHEGDFIVNDYCMGKVIEVTNDAYLLDTGQGIPFSYEHKAHLWTIQDAKDGDVLSANWRVDTNSWERIIIFKKYHSKGIKGLIDAPYVEGYGNTFKNGKLISFAKVPYYSEWTDKLYPATKEQRDLLFQTMKDAGYEWDADKKRVNKMKKNKTYVNYRLY